MAAPPFLPGVLRAQKNEAFRCRPLGETAAGRSRSASPSSKTANAATRPLSSPATTSSASSAQSEAPSGRQRLRRGRTASLPAGVVGCSSTTALVACHSSCQPHSARGNAPASRGPGGILPRADLEQRLGSRCTEQKGHCRVNAWARIPEGCVPPTPNSHTTTTTQTHTHAHCNSGGSLDLVSGSQFDVAAVRPRQHLAWPRVVRCARA